MKGWDNMRYLNPMEVQELKDIVKAECGLNVRYSGKYVLILWSERNEMRVDMIQNEAATNLYRAYMYAEDRYEIFTTNGLLEYLNNEF